MRMNLYILHINVVPPLTLVITPSGPPAAGQAYSLTCGLMGVEPLDVPGADNRFRWDRLSPTPRSTVIRDPTLTFDSLSLADEGEYECTNNIMSPYLTDSNGVTNIQTAIVSTTSKYFMIVQIHHNTS